MLTLENPNSKIDSNLGDLSVRFDGGKNRLFAYLNFHKADKLGTMRKYTLMLRLTFEETSRQIYLECEPRGKLPLAWWEYVGYRISEGDRDIKRQPGHTFYQEYVKKTLENVRNWAKLHPKKINRWMRTWHPELN